MAGNRYLVVFEALRCVGETLPKRRGGCQAASNDPGNSFQAGFDASWEPDVFGGKRNAVNATAADAQAAEASLANVQVSIAAEVAVTYIELRGLQARLAIGALEREVLLQFLIEAVVLASLGGVIGIVLATVASIGLSALMDVPYLFNPGVNLLSFAFSAGIGVLFGYFPARRAVAVRRSFSSAYGQ